MLNVLIVLCFLSSLGFITQTYRFRQYKKSNGYFNFVEFDVIISADNQKEFVVPAIFNMDRNIPNGYHLTFVKVNMTKMDKDKKEYYKNNKHTIDPLIQEKFEKDMTDEKLNARNPVYFVDRHKKMESFKEGVKQNVFQKLFSKK